MVVSKKGGPQYRHPNTLILIIGPPKKVPLILGNPYGEGVSTAASKTSPKQLPRVLVDR